MSVLKKLVPLSVEEYLATEEKGDSRHEFVNGVIYAMVGASVRHNLITGAIFAILRNHMRGSSCRVFQSDMKIRVDQAFYYPDVMVACAVIDPAARYLDAPVLIVEVLSPSTEAKDRLEKLVAYRNLSSLQEYMLVSQDKVQVEIFRRAAGAWQVETFSPGDMVRLVSVGLSAPIESFYEDALGVVDE